MANTVPRRTVQTSPEGQVWAYLRKMRADLDASLRSASLRNASISGGRGLRVYDEAKALRISLNTTDGAVVAYREDETVAARFGPLLSAPGEYGVEVDIDGTLVRIGYQSTTWDSIAGIPAAFTPTAHTHPGSDIDGPVSNAITAEDAKHSLDTDGAKRARENEPSGQGSFFAVWVDANGLLCKNTSSERYKKDIVPFLPDPVKVLDIEPVMYRRKATDSLEFGVIAEQTDPLVPELTIWHEGDIDGFRYDLLPVAQQAVLRQHRTQLATQAKQIADLTSTVAKLTQSLTKLGGTRT